MLALKKSTLIASLGITLFVAFALFVWPTIYRYDHMRLGTSDYPVRTNRLNGKAEVLLPGGWHTPGEESEPAVKSRPLPGEEVAKLQGEPQITNYGWMEFHVYNGSNWDVSEITVLVEVFDADNKPVLSRPYRMTGQVSPQNSSKFLAELGFTLAAGQNWSYGVSGAEGTPPPTR
jgi:hypothetical protein